jgi:membrane protein implicated in regulation of membrane protease activity
MSKLDRFILFIIKRLVLMLVAGFYALFFVFIAMAIMNADFPLNFPQVLFMSVFAGIPSLITLSAYRTYMENKKSESKST